MRYRFTMKSMSGVNYDDIEFLKKQHCNHKCINCKHRFVYAYEDDTPVGRTPYHWWQATCEELNIEISDNEMPPENCPFEAK